jgi:formylglycine-generating enzyme required for sulfatase activity
MGGASGAATGGASGNGDGNQLDASSGPGGSSAPDGGKGGAAGAGGAGGAGGAMGCPLGGAPMVEVPIPMGAAGYPGTYCIDRTEVTNKQYADFLAKNPSTQGQIAACTWNTTYQPQQVAGVDNCENLSLVYDPSNYPTNPVACIDWCDAFAYCKSLGKRLCGAFGGGGVAQGQGANYKNDEWDDACSAAGTKTYPYGAAYQGMYCNTLDRNEPGSIAVAQAVNCIGGYDPIYDMSGNVAEWEDACVGNAGTSDQCLVRGGYFNSYNATASCGSTPSTSRSRISREIGFRCCYDGK